MSAPSASAQGELRLAVLAAFPFPSAQGSQVFAGEQARALGTASAHVTVTMLCYGRGDGSAAEGVTVERIPRWLSPRPLRSGPSAGKPVADAALLARYAAAQRRRRFHVALAHNAEAALVALTARPWLRVPVIYVAHTLLGQELGSYAPRLSRALDRFGGRLDAWIARRADAVVALCEAAAATLRPVARGPVEVIPPGLEIRPAPGPERVARACARVGLAPGRFALYAGNLDGYQDLSELAFAARALGELPVVLATHGAARPPGGPLRVVRVDREDARALLHGAAVAVLPRRRPGGFPIKLLNYMEARRAIVARANLAGTLEHGHSAWLLPPDAPPAALVEAIAALAADPKRARRLGEAARANLERHHAWPPIAQRTLTLAHTLTNARGGTVSSPEGENAKGGRS